MVFVTLLFLVSVLPVSAASLPFNNLSDDDIQQIIHGERVFTILDSYKDVRLQKDGAERSQLIRLVDDVKPNFLAEIIMYIRVDESRDNLAYIQETLSDVVQYDSATYYSIEHEKRFPLFEDSEVLSREKSGEKEVIVAEHLMRPFSAHKNEYTITNDGESLLFIGENITDIRYNNFKAVREGNLLNLLWVRDDGTHLLIYGVGGAKAFTFFGLFGDRMDNAFIGRVEGFFNWYYEEHASNLIK